MSISEVQNWEKLDQASRSRCILEFYHSGDTHLAEAFLALVEAPRGFGVFASTGPNYQYALFGRDSIRVAEDLLRYNKQLAKDVILILVHLQGMTLDQQREEEIGKIHHEYRMLYLGGHKVPKPAQIVLKKLAGKWGGTSEELLYYGSSDATPLFIRLVYRYTQLYGNEILAEIIHGRDGKSRPLRDHVRFGIGWMVTKISDSPWGLLEYRRLNPAGLYNQSWEDSNTSYLHRDGTVANADAGIAAVELQGYAYDALVGAAEIVAASDQEAHAWRQLANNLRNSTLEKFWLADKQYFAMGLDRSSDNVTRQISTLSANSGLLLDTNLLKSLPNNDAFSYIEGVIRMVFSEQFITPVGVRLRSKIHADLLNYADYHGSYVSWPKETYELANGLRNFGFYSLATLLEDCILHAVLEAGEFYEFFYLDKNNQPKYHYRRENPDEPTLHDLGAADIPEPGQAWTISAVLSIIARRQHAMSQPPQSQKIMEIENHILKQPHIQRLLTTLDRSLKSNRL